MTAHVVRRRRQLAVGLSDLPVRLAFQICSMAASTLSILDLAAQLKLIGSLGKNRHDRQSGAARNR
jgi:hypothetical protein